jgi:predicted nucleotidyltransferase
MARKRPQEVDSILAEAKTLLSAQYGHRLKGMVLFGSYARGDFAEGSDIDLLVLLSDLADPIGESEPVFQAICDLSLKHDTVLSVILMDFDAFRTRKTPLIMNARKEGVRI